VSSDKNPETIKSNLTSTQEFVDKNRTIIERVTQHDIWVTGPIIGPIPRGMTIHTNAARKPKAGKAKYFMVPGQSDNPNVFSIGVSFKDGDPLKRKSNKYSPRKTQVPKSRRHLVRVTLQNQKRIKERQRKRNQEGLTSA
jgi:hypothetical protein